MILSSHTLKLNEAFLPSQIHILIFEIHNLLSLYLSVKRGHHIHGEGLEIPMLIGKEKNMDHWILCGSNGPH
jgi:hypothetical protein